MVKYWENRAINTMVLKKRKTKREKHGWVADFKEHSKISKNK